MIEKLSFMTTVVYGNIENQSYGREIQVNTPAPRSITLPLQPVISMSHMQGVCRERFMSIIIALQDVHSVMQLTYIDRSNTN